MTEFESREDRIEAEENREAVNHEIAWDRAIATFWQTLGSSGVMLVAGSQVATWGDLAAQLEAAGLGLATAVASGVLAGALAYARWRGGTPKNTR